MYTKCPVSVFVYAFSKCNSDISEIKKNNGVSLGGDRRLAQLFTLQIPCTDVPLMRNVVF